MQTAVRTPMDVFNVPQHLVVPAFQRPYVWEKEEQWAPLWQDVRRLAELRLAQPSTNPTHFLGAIVVQAQDSILGGLQASSIIDGQQRLTTLQLLMDASSAALEGAGHDALAAQMEQLTHNQTIYVADGSTRLKLRHTNKDRLAFEEVMDAALPIDHAQLKHATSRVVRAHEYFSDAVREWLGTDDATAGRAQELTIALSQGLQLVAINLSADENSQEIFETLNARGTPLTAADLIRNFVFQRIAAEGGDVRQHLDHWPFETDFWEKEVSVGRFPMQRSSLFFNQWLIARTGDEIGPRATFTRFKQYVDEIERTDGTGVIDLLPRIHHQAAAYEHWTTAAADPDRGLNRTELAVYRLRASDTELLKPLLIWLHDEDRSVPPDVIDAVIGIAESWLVRRQLLRLSVGDMGRVVADFVRIHGTTPAAELADTVAGYLAGLNVASTYWPGDKELRETLRTVQAYNRFKRARLRMLLQAVEDRFRETTNQPGVPRREYPIEHILPQSWTDTWPVATEEEAETRAEHVHRLGNLTLLTTSLNSKVSNRPWASKRSALQEHDAFLLNSRLLAAAPDQWDEAAIDARTEQIIEALVRTWPVPDGHEGVVSDPHQKSKGWIQLKHLVDAGLIEPGTVLTAREGSWSGTTAVIDEAGVLEFNGQRFDTPSGAGRAVRGANTDGWGFWHMPDGRKLRDVRAIYKTQDPTKPEVSFDRDGLHAVLEALPVGHWTTYGSLGDTVGTTPSALGAHLHSCVQCANAHRVFSADRRHNAADYQASWDAAFSPVSLLQEEGALIDGKPDPARELNSDELQALIAQ